MAYSRYRIWTSQHLKSGDGKLSSFALEAFLDHASYSDLLPKTSRAMVAHVATGVNPGAHAKVPYQDVVGHPQ
jgi:hypothetical protein